MIRRKINECFLQLENKKPARKEPKKKTKFQGVNSEFYKAKEKLNGIYDKGIQRVLSYRMLRSKNTSRISSPAILPEMKSVSTLIRDRLVNNKKYLTTASSKKHLKLSLSKNDFLVSGSPILNTRPVIQKPSTNTNSIILKN